MSQLMGEEIATKTQKTMSGFGFTGTPVKKLKSDDYTIVTVAVDLSGSVGGWERKLEECIKTIAIACRSSQRVENLIFRVIGFNDSVFEIHGFVELRNINPGDYDGKFSAAGSTALLDAYLNAVESTAKYAADLAERNFISNAVLFIITDGEENSSSISTIGASSQSDKMAQGELAVSKAILKVRSDEVLESIKTILIGVADPKSPLEKKLQDLKDNSKTDEFVMIGSMSKGTLAKLAGFVSKSVSSSSQALLNGGVSQPVNPASVKPIDLTSVQDPNFDLNTI